MKSVLSLLALFIFASRLMSAESAFYIGTFTDGKTSKGIYRSAIDLQSGQFQPPQLVAELEKPGFLAASPDNRFLYAVSGKGNELVAFRIEDGGSLKLLNKESTGGKNPCHVWVDSTGRNVLTADYGSGTIAVFQTNPDGSIRERTDFVQLTGSGPNERRQKGPHAHGIYTDADDRFVYVCDLGTDNVWIFEFDATSGKLAPTEPASGKVPPGGGPRHFALHPNGKFAYANNELTLSVTSFTRNSGTGLLKPIQTISTLPEDTSPEKGFSTAEIACHPSGKWLYVSNRGHNTVAVYRIGDDGKLTEVQIAPATVDTPRGFGIDPSGRWLVIGGQSDNRIAALKIDPETGMLSPVGQSAEVGAPVCILFVE